MGITTVPSAITGQTLSAADWNTQVRDNINGIWVLTTAGDMLYATGASAAARLPFTPNSIMTGGASTPAWLAIGAAFSHLRTNSLGTAPEFGPIIHRRQGGSSTIWTNPGTTTYTPTGTKFMSGYGTITVAGTEAVKAVSYPVTFAKRPHIILSAELSGSEPYAWGIGHTDDTVSGFNFHVKFAGSTAVTFSFGWLAFADA